MSALAPARHRSANPWALALAVLIAVLAPGLPDPALAQSAPKVSRDECIKHKRFDVVAARSCEAQYGLCSNPPSAAWRSGPTVGPACDQVMREMRVQSAATLKPAAPAAPLPGVGSQPAAPALLRPPQGLQPPAGRP